ncbi:MAG: hypothetical protein ACREP5_03590, partial [Candidatus Binatia bacterium]
MAEETPTIAQRDFLKLAGNAAVVSSGLLSGCASVTAGGSAHTAARAIDIHHHYFPPDLIN